MINVDKLYDEIISKVSVEVKKILNETFTTHPYNKILNFLMSALKNLNIVIQIFEGNNYNVPYQALSTHNFDDILLEVWSLTENDIVEKSSYHKRINNVMLLIGYKYSSKFKRDEKTVLKYTPNKQNIFNYEVLTFNQFFYHICPHYVSDKIKKIGFVPKSKNSIFDYDPRIHFYFDGLPKEEYMHLRYLLDMNNISKGNNHEYDIIKVRIPSNIKFYKDLDSEYGVFTTENISPEYIVDIKSIEPMDTTDYSIFKMKNIFNTI